MIPYSKSPLLLMVIFTAQTMMLPVPAAHAQTSVLEEVIVTARKREQSMQDVSVAVTALSESMLKDAQLASSEDLVALVPSLNLQKGGNPRSSSFNIRGIGTQSFSSGIEPSVSTVVDGVVMGQTGMAFMQLLDVQRVEVLRGPQGTLFGKNSSGGVVHIISKDPSDEFEAEASAAAIERGEYRAGFTVSAPITESVGIRVTGSGTMDEGYQTNEFDGEKVNDVDAYNARVKLRWQATEALDIKYGYDESRSDQHCCIATLRSIDSFDGISDLFAQRQQNALNLILPVVPGEKNTRVNLDGDLTTDIQSDGHSLEINWDVGDYTLTSISAKRRWEQFAPADPDGQPEPVSGFNQVGFSDQSQFTQEIRLTSPAEQFVSFVAGLYYFRQTVDRRFDRTFNLSPTLDPAADQTATAQFQVRGHNRAIFGEATINLSDTVRLIVGGRYTEDHLAFNFERVGSTLGAGPVAPFRKSTEEKDTSFKVAAEWNVSDAALTYLSFAQGYKGPAFNVGFGSRLDNTDPVAPETSDAIELGLKSTLIDGRLILNVALFHTEYQDFQASAAQSLLILDENGNTVDVNPMNGEPDTIFSFVLANVGEVTTQGIELDFMAQATENLQLTGGLAFIDAEIDSFDGGPCSFGQDTRGVGFKGQTTCADSPAVQDLEGGELPQSPDWRLTLAVNYTIALESAPFDLAIKGNYRIQDDVLFSIDQDEFAVQEQYDVLDLSLALQDKEERYSATVFVKNVFDEFYVANITSNSDFLLPNGYLQQVPKTARRTVGLEFRYKWL